MAGPLDVYRAIEAAFRLGHEFAVHEEPPLESDPHREDITLVNRATASYTTDSGTTPHLRVTIDGRPFRVVVDPTPLP